MYRKEAHVQEMVKWIQGQVKKAHEYHPINVVGKSITRIELRYY